MDHSLAEQSLVQLRKMAKDMGLKYVTTYNKADLIAAMIALQSPASDAASAAPEPGKGQTGTAQESGRYGFWYAEKDRTCQKSGGEEGGLGDASAHCRGGKAV